MWLHVKVFPYKNNFTNSMELFSLLNLIMLFIMSAFTASNSVAFNVSVALTMFQLMCITVFQIISLQKNAKTLLKIINIVNTIKICFTTLLHIKSEKTQQSIELVNAVPDVRYNHKEFQEPLIGISK